MLSKQTLIFARLTTLQFGTINTWYYGVCFAYALQAFPHCFTFPAVSHRRLRTPFLANRSTIKSDFICGILPLPIRTAFRSPAVYGRLSCLARESRWPANFRFSYSTTFKQLALTFQKKMKTEERELVCSEIARHAYIIFYALVLPLFASTDQSSFFNKNQKGQLSCEVVSSFQNRVFLSICQVQCYRCSLQQRTHPSFKNGRVTNRIFVPSFSSSF